MSGPRPGHAPPVDWNRANDGVACRKCAYSTIIEHSAVGHRLGCTHPEVMQGGLTVPIMTARNYGGGSHAKCGQMGKLWTKTLL